jgi:pimeloyl-ACP methyl ester carboxylesterase
MHAHATDLAALLDRLEVERAVVVGHSMGGFVATTFAAEHPDRVASVLLVDGGLPLPPMPPELSPEEAVAAVIGPAAQRLSMTFADTEAYLDFWRQHPALGPDLSPEVADYFAYDLVGEPPECRSSVTVDSVREDSTDLLDTATIDARAGKLPAGTVFLRADHGMMGEPGGLYPAELARQHAAAYPALDLRDVADVNHYTLVMGEQGATVVAAAIAEVAR